MKKLNGIEIRKKLLEEYQKIIKENDLKITLAIIQIGKDPSSSIYVENKIKYCTQVGIAIKKFLLEAISEEEVIQLIKNLNKDPEITGIILQKPTPYPIDFDKCSKMISPKKDVDGLTEENLFALRNHQEKILPCTVRGILKMFEYYHIPLEGKNIAVIGRSNLIGRPLEDALINRNATVFLCHSKTRNLKEITKISDIVICATGSPNLVTKDMVKDGFIGIDIGINRIGEELVGDFSKDAGEKASYLTPVPGGVGPMTVTMVIHNLIQLKNGMK